MQRCSCHEQVSGQIEEKAFIFNDVPAPLTRKMRIEEGKL